LKYTKTVFNLPVVFFVIVGVSHKFCKLFADGASIEDVGCLVVTFTTNENNKIMQ